MKRLPSMFITALILLAFYGAMNVVTTNFDVAMRKQQRVDAVASAYTVFQYEQRHPKTAQVYFFYATTSTAHSGTITRIDGVRMKVKSSKGGK